VTGSTAALLLRIGRRTILRSRWRSLLIVVLILVPVAGMVGLATVMKTITPTAERSATDQMGQADLLVYPSGPGGDEAALRELLPAGSTIDPIFATSATLMAPGVAVSVTLRSHDPEGVGRGMLTLVSGRYPATTGEVAISAPVEKLASVDIGGTIDVRELGTAKVVGIIEQPLSLTARIVLADPSLATREMASNSANWLVALPAGYDADSMGLPEEGTPTAAGSSPPFSVTTRPERLREASGLGAVTLVLGGLALVDAALVAAAAFAVGVRRRQREIGLIAAAGASPRQLAGSVLAEALLLGGSASLIGAVVGILGALALSPFLDTLTGHRNPTIALDVPIMAGALGLGIVATLVAALGPALGAAHLPVLDALSGRRPPTTSSRRAFGLGIAVLVGGIALTAAGAGLRLADPLGSMSLVMLLGGAVLGTLGLGSCSPWLLGQLERPAARLPLASRIALRDTARARTRNAAIVTALLAATGGVVALGAYQASVEASYLAKFRPPLLADQIFVSGGAGVPEAGPELARELGAIAGGPIPGVGSDTRYVWISPTDSTDPNVPLVTQSVTVGDAELLKALGAEAAADDLEQGSIVLLTDKPAPLTQMTVHVASRTDGSDVSTVRLPVHVIPLGISFEDLPGAVISAETAARLGVPAGQSQRYILRLGHPVTEADAARVAAIAAKYPDTWTLTSRPPEIAGSGFRIVLIGGSILFALSVTGIAVALGEAESRPEQRTLLAIGADRRLRRKITAARAGVIALLGGLLAVPAGLLPVWGLLVTRNAPLVVPVPEVIAAVALLPVLAIAATWLFSRPIPEWSAFRGPTS
jgi:putative ABC transport system permease protein